MAQTALDSLTAELRPLEELYQIRNPREVFKFLLEYPSLIPVLKDTPAQIKNFFPDAQLLLSYEVDPEIVGLADLALIIAPTEPPLEAMEKLLQFRTAWNAAQPIHIKKILSITMEYL